MATTPWTDENLPLVPFQGVPLLPDGQAWEGALVRTPDGMGYLATPAQLQSQVTPVLSGTKPTITLAPVGTATVGVQKQLSATADNGKIPIVKVEFFAGTTLIESDTASPYGATYTPTGPGTVYITAKVTDANGQTAVSAAQPVAVNAQGTATNLPPTVSVSATPTTIQLGAGTTLTATATDLDGTVASVDFYDGADRIGGSASAPFVINYVPTSVGQHVFTAKATDNLGVSTTKTVTVQVQAAPVATVTPAAPVKLEDDDANTISFSSPLGDSEIVISINSGAYGPYNGQIVVGNVNRVPGYYKAKIKAATGRAESGVTSSNAFNSTTANQLPVASAGQDITITSPASQASLFGSGTDSDGTITAYSWSQQSGPNIATGIPASTANVSVTGLVIGAYIFRLTVTDDKGATRSDDVKVTVASAPSNQLPIVNAGNDISITLPTNQVGLSGTATDPDGTIASYLWEQITGPNNATGLPSPTQNRLVTSLIAGIYQFRLTATDDKGGSKTDDVIVTVNAAAALPVYGTYVSLAKQTDDGMSIGPDPSQTDDGLGLKTERLEFDRINNTSGPTISIGIKAPGNTKVIYIDFASEYQGKGYAYFDANGGRHDDTFPGTDNLNITY